MNQTKQQENYPPKLQKTSEGDLETNSLADLLDWFLSFDERVAVVRHVQVEEVFQWKQKDDIENGVDVFPFENAEARFAVGVFQAIAENDTEEKLGTWITSVLEALGEAKQKNEDIAKSYGLEQDRSHVEQARSLPSNIERRLYLTSCWIESLCTAETRFLGWVYQELYDRTFVPNPGN